VAERRLAAEAWEKAYATDRKAPFAESSSSNQTMDGALAKIIAEIFHRGHHRAAVQAMRLTIFARDLP